MAFWARRRAAVEAEAKAEEARRAETILAEREADFAEKSDEDLLEELGLPAPESIGSDGDFRAFMAEGVPQRLKTRALRCLWRSNPVLANVDGLVDYGEDFTDATRVIENLQTAYQVGKGMTAHVEELARKAEALARAGDRSGEVAAPETDDTLEATASAETEAAETPPDQQAQADAGASGPGGEAACADDTVLSSHAHATTHPPSDDMAELPPRRRMSFTFDDTSA